MPLGVTDAIQRGLLDRLQSESGDLGEQMPDPESAGLEHVGRFHEALSSGGADAQSQFPSSSSDGMAVDGQPASAGGSGATPGDRILASMAGPVEWPAPAGGNGVTPGDRILLNMTTQVERVETRVPAQWWFPQR